MIQAKRTMIAEVKFAYPETEQEMFNALRWLEWTFGDQGKLRHVMMIRDAREDCYEWHPDDFKQRAWMVPREVLKDGFQVSWRVGGISWKPGEPPF